MHKLQMTFFSCFSLIIFIIIRGKAAVSEQETKVYDYFLQKMKKKIEKLEYTSMEVSLKKFMIIFFFTPVTYNMLEVSVNLI